MVEYLTKQQIRQLQALTKVPRNKLLLKTQYETGCTSTELVNIKKRDVKETHIRINNRKAHISDQLYEELTRYAKTHQSPYLFTSRQQDQLTTKRVQQITKKLLKQLDKQPQKLTPHILRYSHIVHAAQQHIPLPDIMRQTGLAEQRISQILAQTLESDEEAYRRLNK